MAESDTNYNSKEEKKPAQKEKNCMTHISDDEEAKFLADIKMLPNG